MCRGERATWANQQVCVATEQHKFDELLLLCVWATTTAWYVAIYLLPARGRSLAAIRQVLACRVPELSIIPYATSPDWKQKTQSSFQRVQQSCHARLSRLLGQRLCDSMHVWIPQRLQSCVRTTGDIISTAVGIIQYWEGTPHLVLISVLLFSDAKISFCLQEIFEAKIFSAGSIRAFSSRANFWRAKFSENFPRNTRYYGDKILSKNLDLTQDFPTRFCFTPYGNKILYKIFPRFSDCRKCTHLATS